MKRIVGKLGTADPITRRLTPSHAASISAWLISAPLADECFSHWAMYAIHLRDLPGVKPAVRDYPEAGHEVVIYTFNPDAPRWGAARPEEFRLLRPFCFRMQLEGLTDEETVRRVVAGVKLALAGELPLEPPYDSRCYRMDRAKGGTFAEGQDLEYMAKWALHFAADGYQAILPGAFTSESLQ